MLAILTAAFLKVNSVEQNFFHMNVSFLCHNFDDLQTLLTRINIKFNIIGITATRLKKLSDKYEYKFKGLYG